MPGTRPGNLMQDAFIEPLADPGEAGRGAPDALGHGTELRYDETPAEEGDVAVSPGAGFGPAGEGYVRMALVENVKRLPEGARVERVRLLAADLSRPVRVSEGVLAVHVPSVLDHELIAVDSTREGGALLEQARDLGADDAEGRGAVAQGTGR